MQVLQCVFSLRWAHRHYRDGATRQFFFNAHGLFDGDYPPTSLHEFLAWLPGALRARGHSGNQLILSTNYDDVLERAFDAAGESFDLLTYIAKGRDCGKFSHQPPGGEPRVIERPNEYYDISLKTRSVIIKIHGAVKRKSENASGDSYVITEDDYLDYLTRTDISNLVPAPLAAKLKNSNFLFLGHSLRDWNLRVILRRIWGEQELDSVSWAVQRSTDELDRTFWAKHNVKIWAILLEDYVAALHRRVQTLLAPAAAS